MHKKNLLSNLIRQRRCQENMDLVWYQANTSDATVFYEKTKKQKQKQKKRVSKKHLAVHNLSAISN